jgi:hypothetical protein
MNILWEYIKDLAFVPPLPRNLAEMKECILAAVSAAVDGVNATKGLGWW